MEGVKEGKAQNEQWSQKELNHFISSEYDQLRKGLGLESENSAWYVTLIWTGDRHVREAWHVPEADWARDWGHYWGGERHSLFYEDDETV